MKKVFPVFMMISLLAVVSLGFIQVSTITPFATFRICCDTDCSPSGCQDSTWTEFASNNNYLSHRWALDFFGESILGQTYAAFNACRTGWTGGTGSRYHCSRCDTEDEADPQPCHFSSVKRTCTWWRTNKATPSAPSISMNGTITISWSSVTYADIYRIKRSVDGAAYSTLATQTSTSYYDNLSSIGYSNNIKYQVFAINEDESNGDAEILSSGSNDVQYDHPEISPSPSSISFTGSTMEETKNDVFTVNNGGDGSFSWSASTTDSWIKTISPSSGNPSDAVDVTVDRSEITSNLSTLTHNGIIKLESTGLSDVNVSVSVNLITPAAPSNCNVVNAGSWGNPPQLSWSSVTLAAGYKVYRKINSGSWSHIDSPSSNSYTDNDVDLMQYGDLIYYYVKAWNGAGDSSPSNTTSTIGIAAEARKEEPEFQLQIQTSLPKEYGLMNCYPNPANPGTTVKFQLPESAEVDLKVVNINGQIIRQLVTGQKSAGYYEIYWNGLNDQQTGVGTGMYLFVLRAGGRVFTKKFSLVK